MRLIRDGLPVLRHGLTSAEATLRAIAALPLGDLDALVGDRPVLVLAPHPDDESLGCGGLIAALCARGQPVEVLVLTDGTGSHPRSTAYPPERLRALREAETIEAAACLGLASARVHFLRLRDTAAPHFGREARRAAACIAEHALRGRAGTICTTWRHDPHRDHLAASRLARRAARATGARLLQYPVWGWTLSPAGWLPARPVRGLRLDITGHREAKRLAIAAHRSQTTALIDDDPAGFRLLDEVLGIFAGSTEAYLTD